MRPRKTIEEHCADFILLHRGEAFRDYRKRCIEFWREHYGQAFSAKVEMRVIELWRKK